MNRIEYWVLPCFEMGVGDAGPLFVPLLLVSNFNAVYRDCFGKSSSRRVIHISWFLSYGER